MRKGIWLAAIVVFFVAPHRAAAQQTQQSGQSQPSAPSKTQTSETQRAAKSDPLVEAARKAREAQKNAPKASEVFTNDNIPATPGAVSVVGSTAAEASSKPSSSSDKTASAGQASSSTKDDEATWRKKFADARQKLAQDQTELSVLQRESDQLQLQYYPDPTKALMQSVDRSDIIKKQKAIDDKKKDIDADQQALSTLESELRKAGGDPGWARE
jgi:chromosome segregation ATPase